MLVTDWNIHVILVLPNAQRIFIKICISKFYEETEFPEIFKNRILLNENWNLAQETEPKLM